MGARRRAGMNTFEQIVVVTGPDWDSRELALTEFRESIAETLFLVNPAYGSMGWEAATEETRAVFYVYADSVLDAIAERLNRGKA